VLILPALAGNGLARMQCVNEKWTAFLLSLVVPGAGQLAAGSLWCVPWFLGAAMLVGAWLVAGANQSGALWQMAQAGSLVVVGVVSAEHAKRSLERRRAEPGTRVLKSSLTRSSIRRTAVSLRLEVLVAMDAAELWRRVADLPTFLTIDPFHEKITLMRREPAAGVDVVLWHNTFGRRSVRFGRILWWEEGRGYALSDISRRGPRCDFPHVFFIRVEPVRIDAVSADRGKCARLTIDVRGKWTSCWIPAAVGRCWMRWVMREHARLLRKAL
jgi:hypothetical protein